MQIADEDIFSVSLPVDGFYKGIRYVLLYKTLNKADIIDISLSIAVTQHPQSVIQHIWDVRKWEVTERERGIYIIRGFLFPIQIIENKKLSREHRSFLSMLNKNLDKETVKFVLKEAEKTHKIDISAYIDVIAQANPQRLKEILKGYGFTILRRGGFGWILVSSFAALFG